MKKTMFLFDLDGTLTDPAEGITRSVAYSLAGMGIAVPEYGELCRWIGPPLMESYEQRYGLTGEAASRALALYREYFVSRGIFENKLYEGIPELLRDLKKAGAGVYMATSKPEPFAVSIAEHFGIAGYFDRICGSTLDETRTNKADVIAYLLEAEHAATETTQILMIGDREHDVRGALQHRIPCCGVLYGYGSKKELEAAGAKYTVESVTALKNLLISLIG